MTPEPNPIDARTSRERWQAAEIERLTAELATANHWRERHCKDAEAYGQQSMEHWKKLRAAESERDAAMAFAAGWEAQSKEWESLYNAAKERCESALAAYDAEHGR